MINNIQYMTEQYIKILVYTIFIFVSFSTLNAITLFELLDTYVPNIFVRWSGIVVKRLWQDILPMELNRANSWTDLDKKYGVRYSWEIGQDYKKGISPNTDFKKSCIGILNALDIKSIIGNYKNSNTLCNFDDLVNGNVSLKIIQIAKHNKLANNYRINIIFNTKSTYYSVVAICTHNIQISNITADTTLLLLASDELYSQCLQLRIDWCAKTKL